MADQIVTETVVRGGGLRVITLDWTSATAGGSPVASGVQHTLPAFFGEVVQLVTVPGTPAPASLYDVALNDEDGLDVIGGEGANRSATVAEVVGNLTTGTSWKSVVKAPLVLNITNAGAATQGKVRVFARENQYGAGPLR